MIKKIIAFAVIIFLVCLFVWKVSAQSQESISPTIVVGEAQTADGNENLFMVEQPSNAPNPLGDPIISTEANTQNSETKEDMSAKQQNSESSVKSQDEQPKNAEQAGKDFENTLIEANGRIYDVQSYPEGDLPIMGDSANPETIYSPNVNP